MIDGIKGCRKIMKDKTCHFLVFKSPNDICLDLKKRIFHAMECTVGWLVVFHKAMTLCGHQVD